MKRTIHRYCDSLAEAEQLARELQATILSTPRFFPAGIYTFKIDKPKQQPATAIQQTIFHENSDTQRV